MIPARLLDKRFRLQTLFPLLSRLPLPVAYWLATRLGSADAKYRRGATANELGAVEAGMRLALPELASDATRCAYAVRQYAEWMARDKLDCFFMTRFARDGCHRLIEVAGLEHLAEARDEGRGVILVISHFGRFFMLGPGLGLNGFPFAMLTTAVDESNPGWDAVDLAYMRAKMANTLQYSQHEWITTAHDYRRVFRALRRGLTVLIAMDGLETNSKEQLTFPFLGGTLRLPAGIARIAERTGSRLVYASTKQATHGWGVSIQVHRLASEPTRALTESVAILERDLKIEPWHWWQWPLVSSFWQAAPPSSCI